VRGPAAAAHTPGLIWCRYELDLLMWGAFSYGLPGTMGPTLGSLYVQHLVQTFSNASAPGITLEFGCVRDIRFAPFILTGSRIATTPQSTWF
jgi:hypothetical protein